MTACRCRFHDGCTVHDDEGRRWDSYTPEEVAALEGVAVMKSEPEWSCYCGRHKATNDEMPEGTPCVWKHISHEYDEWECECLEAYRDSWLYHQTVDWAALGRAADRRWRISRWLTPLRYFFLRIIYRLT